MKIISRFVDGYDFDASISRSDDVTYYRKFSYTKLLDSKDTRKELKDVPKGLFLKVGDVVLRVIKDRVLLDETYSMFKIYTYDKTLKCAVKHVDNRTSLSTRWLWSYELCHRYMSPVSGSDVSGKLFINKGMIEYIKKAASTPEVHPTILRYMSGEVCLMYVDDTSVSVADNLNLIASGLYGAYKVHFGSNLAGIIDMALSTREVEEPFTLTDKAMLERRGFDNKVSFRHRRVRL